MYSFKLNAVRRLKPLSTLGAPVPWLIIKTAEVGFTETLPPMQRPVTTFKGTHLSGFPSPCAHAL